MVPWVSLKCVIVVVSDHSNLFFIIVLIGQIISIQKVYGANRNLSGKLGMKLTIQ